MAIGAFLGVLVLIWYPIYKRFVFPKILQTSWFRNYFNIDDDHKEAHLMGLDIQSVNTGFWFFYILIFIILSLAAAFTIAHFTIGKLSFYTSSNTP
tara:strand:+ start:1014 stop:1301 length:288 start_codon:yes stop_codon:yes gene_type:complete